MLSGGLAGLGVRCCGPSLVEVVQVGGCEAEPGEDSAAPGVHAGQDGHVGVEVVVYFDADLVGVGALDAADLLDHASFERGRAGQDQCVEVG